MEVAVKEMDWFIQTVSVGGVTVMFTTGQPTCPQTGSDVFVSHDVEPNTLTSRQTCCCGASPVMLCVKPVGPLLGSAQTPLPTTET